MEDEKIGYKKPPVATRFTKGQSGNPKGRPKGSKNLHTIVKRELDETVIVTEGGQKKKATKLEVIIKSIFNKAIKGDGKASEQSLNLIREVEALEEIKNIDIEALNKEDQEIFDNFKESLVGQGKKTKKNKKEVINV